MVLMQYISAFFSGFILSELIHCVHRRPGSALIRSTSPSTFPPHAWLQVPPRAGSIDARFGRSMGLVSLPVHPDLDLDLTFQRFILVLPQPLRSEWSL